MGSFDRNLQEEVSTLRTEKLSQTCSNSRVQERIVWRLFVGRDWELEVEEVGENLQGETLGEEERMRKKREEKKLFELSAIRESADL